MKTVLIVEDAVLNRDLLVQLLDDSYRLLMAEDGADAIEIAVREHPDLILMDMSLPRIDGWEATRRLKNIPECEDIPIVAVTAHAMRGDEARIRKCGCDDYLSKPVDENLLFEKLEAFLGSGGSGQR